MRLQFVDADADADDTVVHADDTVVHADDRRYVCGCG
jgi:hypothetical protein